MNVFGDPVPALGEGDRERLSGALNKSVINAFLAEYVNRVEKTYSEQYSVSPELIDWLGDHEIVRETLWLALSPQYDNIPEAVEIFDTLRIKHPKKIGKYYHLAVAVAVVWDTPDAVEKSRHFTVWGIGDSQFGELLSYEEIFEYFTNPRYMRSFVYKPDALPWPMLVHLVDFDITPREYEWALANYKGKRSTISRTYSEVKYDYQKLGHEEPKLGSRMYTLPNILQYGGICGDQSHFASRIAKAFGVPAMKVAGKGRYGGSGHAWVGYLVTKGREPTLEFTGRYLFDYYYTGDVFDPQTKTRALERYVAMMYEGASASYSRYIDSLTLARVAESIKRDEPELSLKLAEYAVKTNYFCKPAWELLIEHIGNGTMDRKTGLSWFNTMIKKLKGHPDMTMKSLPVFMRCIPGDDTARRQKTYDQVFKLYRERPDLQIRLRITQCRELADAGLPMKALTLALETCRTNAKEGALILPLVEQCVDIAKKNGLSGKLLPELKKVQAGFPKKRGDKTSPAYMELKELMNSLM